VDKKELEKRTKAFALRVIRFVSRLPNNKLTNVMGYQLRCPEPAEGLKPGTSIGANYREANRAESRSDFIHKTCAERSGSIAIAEKEGAEIQYWLDLFEESNIGDPNERRWLLQESGGLLAIFTSIGKTGKSRRATNSKSEIGNSK
jgi:four helix bundle protein